MVDPVVVEVQLFELGESLKDVRFQGCETVLTETESFEEGTEAREVEGRKGGVDELKVGEFEVLHEGVKRVSGRASRSTLRERSSRCSARISAREQKQEGKGGKLSSHLCRRGGLSACPSPLALRPRRWKPRIQHPCRRPIRRQRPEEVGQSRVR